MTQTNPSYSGYTGSLLYQWLGSFWSTLCEDSELVKQMQAGHGVLAAKLYQEFAECLDLVDRKNLPVYHNDLTTTILFKLTERNTSSTMSIRMDMDIPLCIGPQTAYPFTIGKIPTVGGIAPFEGIVAYPIDPKIKDINVLVDNIAKPSIILVKDVNFSIEDQVIYFINNSDPFDNETVIKTNVYDATGIIDKTITLFAYNTLIDRDYIYNYAGYIFNLKSESSEQYKTATNNLWDMYNYGPVKQRLQASIAALLGEPCIINDTETIVAIITNDYVKQIVTDTNVYTVTLDSIIRTGVVKGATLNSGDLLTETIKVYENIDFTRLTASNEYCQQFVTDVPALLLPTCFFRAKLVNGLGVSFELTNIVNDGIDRNGNTKFKFNMYGSPDDVNTLWADVVNYCETKDIEMASIFEGVLDASYSNHAGAICGRLEPLKFFLNNMFKANMFIVVVNTSNLTTFGRTRFKDINKVRTVLPASVYMFVLDKMAVTDVKYELDLLITEDYTSSVAKNVNDTGSYRQIGSKRILTYYDAPILMRWVPVCSAKIITPAVPNAQGFVCKENI